MAEQFYSWDSEITNDAPEYTLLPEGNYPFMVQGLEKQIYTGTSEKIGNGCPMAVLEIVVRGEEGNASVKDRLYLTPNMEWKLSSFFRSIGMKQHGKSFKMDWNSIIGKEGLCHIKIDTWTDQNGQSKQSNKIDKYLDNDAAKAPTKPADMPFEI